MRSTTRPVYRPIADYGVIGDCRGAALVASDGSIDWWCPTRFDAPSVFASILDKECGGFFRVHGGERAFSHAAYVPNTNVLRTEFRTGSGVFELLDFMPMGPRAASSSVRLWRVARGLEGTSRIHVEFVPRFDYGRVVPRLHLADDGRVVARGAGQSLALASAAPLETWAAAAWGEMDLAAGEEAAFAVSFTPFEQPVAPPAAAYQASEALTETVEWWRAWAQPHDYEGPWREAVLRSALVLKLLTYGPTGAVVAAPTCSLPEWIGGVRNWDYRYSWVRDAVFAVRALREVGHADEARRFVEWIVRSADPDPARLRVLYSVNGTDCTPEQTLPHLAGYRNSKPVRIGNAAEHQFQLDVYGELVEGAYACGLLQEADADGPAWSYFRRLADWVAAHWRDPDQGIWEMRCPPRHFVLSKAFAWAALDRMAQVAVSRGLEGEVDLWRREAEACRAEALERGWSEPLGAFKQSYEIDQLDAANLLLPIIGFVEPDDPRMLSTLDRTREHLTVNGLVYRYLDAEDGVGGAEATFTYCTFWLIEALAMAGRTAEARELFERVLARASPLGLFAEELNPVTGEHLGNYPQGFPHIGLIRAARRLAKAEREAQAPRAASP